tara:strand:- start:2454 stop:3185 length:732 start_codon:yes stop_codon:yes gene_type:complete
MKIIAVVPARSGSKGVPKKNIKDLGGKPLMAFSIMAGVKSKYINRVIVSTDTEEFAGIAKSYGAECPFLRPAEISGDKASDYELMNHLIHWLKENEGEAPDLIVHLRPTTPLRNVSQIDKAIEVFIENKQATALRSIHEMSESAYKTFELLDEQTLVTTFKHENDLDGANKARQSFPKTYFANGYVDVLSADFIVKNNRIHGNKVLPFITEPVVEVDTSFDFELLEMMNSRDRSCFNNLFGEN